MSSCSVFHSIVWNITAVNIFSVRFDGGPIMEPSDKTFSIRACKLSVSVLVSLL